MADPKFHELMKEAREALRSARRSSEKSRDLSVKAADQWAWSKRIREGAMGRGSWASNAHTMALQTRDLYQRLSAKETEAGKASIARARDLRAEAHKLLGGKK